MSAEITKMLVLSTAHLTEYACNQWLAESCPWACYEKAEIGYFMYACDDTQPGEPGVPAEIAPIIAFARANGCDWVMFDCDAPEIEGLPVYDW